MTSRLFGVGIAGMRLTSREREIFERYPPRVLILFRRNIESVEQTSALIAQIRTLPGSPFVCVDQEGGEVDRLRDALAPFISWREAALAGAARLAGRLAGEACGRIGFDVNLAPVLDRLIAGKSEGVLKDRCASEDPEKITRAATEFLAGLHAAGVGGCVKHFPGLGRADLDTHQELPRVPVDPAEEERDLAPFAATMEIARAVMISHAAGPEGLPASLSTEKAQLLLRERLGFTGAAFSDDLEMGALSGFGDLPHRCVLAARAGCDLLFVCRETSAYPQCAEAVERDVPAPRRAQSAARLDDYERHLENLRALASVAERPLEDLVADIHALRESSRARVGSPK